MMGHRWVAALVVLGTGPAWVPSAALRAQGVGEARVAFEVRAGYEDPTRDLGRSDLLWNEETGWGYARFQQASGTPFIGGGLRTNIAGGLSLRLNVDYAFQSTVDGQWFCDALTPCPAVLQAFEATVDRWSAGGDLVLSIPQLGLPVTPHVYLGAVRRSYALRWNAPIAEIPIPSAYDEANWFLRPGIGVSRALGRFHVFGEAEALVGNSFQTKTVILFEGTVPVDPGVEPQSQVDLTFSVGARFGLW